MKLFAVTTSALILTVLYATFASAQDTELTFEQPKYIFVTYIESLCRFSAKFINEQLVPNYDSIKDFVTVLMYSCGKMDITTMRDGSVETNCQHGDQECRGNKLQNCAMHIIKEEADRVSFIGCTMENVSKYVENITYADCCERVGISNDELEACADGPLGDALLQKCIDDSADYFAESNKVPVCVWGNSTHPPYDANAEAFMQQDFKQWVDYTHRVENASVAAAIQEAAYDEPSE